MQLRSTEILHGHIEDVFAALSDFAAAEAAAMERGLDVQRRDALGTPGEGMQWKVAFFARGRDREAEFELVKYTRPTGMRYEGHVGGLLFETSVACRVLDSNSTEVTVSTKLRARSMSAKVLLQSMKLARGRVVQRYRKGVRRLLHQVESRGTTSTG
ncbi:hypothetical protein [Tropicimonas sp. S265A]|uniref:hypothetical protein n=1 Tax=Tropicimonas sp. S265A TaxID=3415134 RepID=UPI003C7BA852